MPTRYAGFVIIILGICVLQPSGAKAQSATPPKSRAVTEALNEYKTKLANLGEQHKAATTRVDATFTDDATKLKAELLVRLEEVRKETTKADDLDEAVRIRDVMREIEAAKVMPPDGSAPVTPAPKDKEPQDRKKLEAEVARLKAIVAKKEAASRNRDLKELALKLVGTKWKSAAGGELFEFPTNDQVVWEGRLRGKWSIDSEDAIVIEWIDQNLRGTIYFNSAITSGVYVNSKGNGEILKLVK
jgi:hypothetical protein